MVSNKKVLEVVIVELRPTRTPDLLFKGHIVVRIGLNRGDVRRSEEVIPVEEKNICCDVAFCFHLSLGACR